MPSKKKKYNARFPAGRIKKIMQTDEEVGKVAQAVPVIISRTLELFVESLIKKSIKITKKKNARTLSPHHMKLCILSESRFDFLRELVKGVPLEGSNSDDDTSSAFESSASSHSDQRSTRETNVSTQPKVVEEPPVAVCPSFYREIDDSCGTPSTTSHPGSTSAPPVDPPCLESKNELHSDNDSDSQSTDDSALVVNSNPDQNLSTSCDMNEEKDSYT